MRKHEPADQTYSHKVETKICKSTSAITNYTKDTNMATFTTEGKTITCKAAVQFERKGELKIVDVNVAPPKRLEVRIKIIGSGVCHTDYSEPLYASQQFPVILGHEGGGIVEVLERV